MFDIDASSTMIRTTFNTDGQLAFGVHDDVIIMSLSEADDMYGHYRQYASRQVGNKNYRDHAGTRIWDVRLTAYGPNSHSNLDRIRSGVLTLQSSRMLTPKDIYIVPTVPVIHRSPEIFGGQWYERADMTLRYNELYVFEEYVGRIDEVNIIPVGNIKGGNN